MNTLNYENFTGTFNYIEEDDVLYGKIAGINDLVTYEGTSIREIKKAFKEAVEDYIELCRKAGKNPYKSFKGVFNVRVSPELHRKAALKAIKLNIHLNQFVQKALEKAVKSKS
jgi:predicted HicB family RNase H-like nuclease